MEQKIIFNNIKQDFNNYITSLINTYNSNQDYNYIKLKKEINIFFNDLFENQKNTLLESQRIILYCLIININTVINKYNKKNIDEHNYDELKNNIIKLF